MKQKKTPKRKISRRWFYYLFALGSMFIIALYYFTGAIKNLDKLDHNGTQLSISGRNEIRDSTEIITEWKPNVILVTC